MLTPNAAQALPWLAAPLQHLLQTQRAHALLLHGPQGVGQFELGLTLAQAWLCEAAQSPSTDRPCGACASCRLVSAHSHPDLLVLLPEALREALGWESSGNDDSAAESKGKAKPSKEIKVEAVRQAVVFAQTTSARGRGKVVVLHPAERMNGVAANTLLKTLEEPPGNARFVLGCAAPEALLPTIRSRCQAIAMGLPAVDVATAWLVQKGVANAEVMLAAAGGQPLEALEWTQQGIDAASWVALPARVARGDASAVAAWPLPRVVDALQKICHDAMCLAVGAAPRYFPLKSLTAFGAPDALGAWHRELQRIARHAEHPFNLGLVVESLMQQAKVALAPRAGPGRSPKTASIHSAA